MSFTAFDTTLMRRALDLARRGEGRVEPNPMVGAVVARPGDVGSTPRIVGEGWHARHGGPHAEVEALAAAGVEARGATLYVTLEPCCHQGKTPPCTDAIVAAGVGRVVVAAGDPFPEVAGRGLRALVDAGVAVETGLLEEEAVRLTAPFRKRVGTGMPWVIAKWAMSIDGRLATGDADRRWISSEASRGLVHLLRGRCDAIAVGIGTALADDPMLTPRSPGPRRPLRVVLDGRARLPATSRLVRTASEAPLLVAAGPLADPERVAILEAAGCEVWRGNDADPTDRLRALLRHLAARGVTNLLAEGGATLLGSLFDAELADELWMFIAPCVVGGATSRAPDPPLIDIEQVAHPGGDLLVRGIVRRSDRVTSPEDPGREPASASPAHRPSPTSPPPRPAGS